MTETAVETYETTTRGAASMAAYRAVRILQLLSENTGEDKAMLSDELIRRLAGGGEVAGGCVFGGAAQHLHRHLRTSPCRIRN